MKKNLLFICLIIIISCAKKESTVDANSKNSTIPKTENRITDTVSEKHTDIESVTTTDRPAESKIIKSKFDVKLLFGIWTYDPNGPHADFQLTKKSFYVVDYDGDGDMPYIINHDTIKVFYNDYTGVGIIKNASNDTLQIDWDGNGTINYVKWKG